MINETIAAIATAVGTCGIGVVRISGDRAIPVADLLFSRSIANFPSHTVHYGKLKNPQTGEHIDDVLLTVFRAPNSYTGEDTVEVSCHGGIQIIREALSAAYAAGARPAEPGEFTKRAFLNGRLDLAQAEAVNDLIQAQTEDSRRLALRQLEGELSREVKQILDRVTGMLASVEASIDFPEDVDQPEYTSLSEETNDLITALDQLITSSSTGRIYREGIRLVIAGRPNVGKSSILNALLRESRAIVTPVPGTTRDVIEEAVNIRGIPVVAVDTAGLRHTEDVVEKIGVELTEKSLESADLVLAVLDASQEISDEDNEVIRRTAGRPVIIVLNKADLTPSLPKLPTDAPTVATSASTGKGIDTLEDEIAKLVLGGKISTGEGAVVTNARHRLALQSARESLAHVIDTIDQGLPIDLLSTDLMAARSYLGEITGETASEDLIDRIFSDFCIGK